MTSRSAPRPGSAPPLHQPDGHAVPGRDGALALARRLDWRFLLPEPRLRSVAVVGCVDRSLLQALAEDGEITLTSGPAQVVLAVRPTLAELRAAAARVAGDGYLVAELHGPMAGPSSGWPLGARVRAACRDARRAGLTDQRLAWHWPSHRAGLEVASLGDRDALEVVLARHTGRAPRLAAGFVRLALRLGILGAIWPAVTLVARRPAPGRGPSVPAPAAAVAALVDVADDAHRQASDRVVLLTPRYRASRHVVGLVLRRDAAGAAIVVKTPRRADDGDGLQAEAAALGALTSSGTVPPGVPRLLAHRSWEGRPWLIETALDGRLLGRHDVADRRDETVARVVAWLHSLPPRPGPADLDRLIVKPLDALESVVDAAASHAGDGVATSRLLELVRMTRTALAPLLAGPCPAVIEHGDLAPPNILVLEDGAVGVVDWELAQPDGLPLADLAFFLAWVASAPHPSTSAGTIGCAVDAALLAPGGWAYSLVRAEARRLGLGDEITDLLVLAVWPRAIAALASRVGPRADLVGWLADHRYTSIWRRAAARTAARQHSSPGTPGPGR